MPAENREGDVLRALRELGTDGGTVEDVASRSGLASRATKRHLYNLQASGQAECATEDAPPFRRVWRIR